jgi:hypothetical protein
MSTSTDKDPLDGSYQPDRVFYAVGALLGVEDFTDEQTYHRGRLARALAFLDGSGTVAGLRVDYQPPANPDTGREDEEIIVRPGIALDRLGRIIEVPRDACIRLDRWFGAQTASDVTQGLHGDAAGVIADVFIRFVACERGKTPAFATGPFDATDYAAPSRVRDGYKLELVIRAEGVPPVPQNPWPDLASEPDITTRRAALQTAIFDAWGAAAHQRDERPGSPRRARRRAGHDVGVSRADRRPGGRRSADANGGAGHGRQ